MNPNANLPAGSEHDQSNIQVGYLAGEKCNRNNCEGIIQEKDMEGGCSCHINPPCSYCTTPKECCDICGWDAKEEYDEDNRMEYERYRKSPQYERDQEETRKRIEAENLFWKKYRGEIPADKLEIMPQGHTHFTMRKIGVFPKGTETAKSIEDKVRGTFGGRFERLTDYSFDYIAYTD